jgi:hypothetical protein
VRRQAQFTISSTTETQAQLDYAAGLRKTSPADPNQPEELQIARAEGQEETRKAAELHLADHCSLPEYKRRRQEMETTVTEPKIPLDEATYHDYRLRRAKGEQ